jgi:hypothetical protein
MTTIYTLTLQTGPEAVDTYLDSLFPTVNFAGEGMLGGGAGAGGTEKLRTLIDFSLAGLPAGAQIVSATLSLYLQLNFASAARLFRVFRVKRAWKLDDASWNEWSAGQAWQTAGGFGANDCEQTDIGSISVPAADAPGTAHAFGLTAAAVQDWVSGAFANNGLLLKADVETDDSHFWHDSDYVPNPSLRPKLVITYTLGGPGSTLTGDQPGYDLTLDDGVNPPLGLLAGGAAGPVPGAIRRLPRGPGVERKAVQANDWTGGRGNARHATDQSRFYDSAFAWTMTPGQVLPAPLARFGNGPAGNLRRYGAWPGDLDSGRNPITTMRWVTLTGGTRFVADDFTAVASLTQIFAVRLIVRRVGQPAGPLIMSLRSDSAGTPGAVVASGELPYGAFPEYAGQYVYDWLSRVFPFKFPSTQTIVAGTKYWISIGDKNGTGTAANHWEVLWGLMVSGSAPTAYQSTDGTTWSGVAGDKPALFMRITNSIQGGAQTGNDDVKRFFFEYQRQLYLASTTQVLRNGDRGVCTGTQAAGKIVDTTKAWTTDAWAGCVAQITGPVGSALLGQARKITSNTATELTLQGNWPSTPAPGAGGTEYAILGSDEWTQVDTLLGGVTDVAVMNNIVYFACGNAAVMRHFRESNLAGVWTLESEPDGTNKCDFIEVFQEGEKVYLYHASNALVKWNRAEQVAWPTNLTFEAGKPVGDVGTLVTGLTVHEDVYITKEDEVRVIKNGIATLIPVPINTARDLNNGVGVRGWNTQLYFPFLDGFERLFGRTVDDIGPNRQEGMPPSRRGRVADFLPVLQYGFVAWDAGFENVESQTKGRFSALLATTAPGGDWHELYRTDWKSRRILSLFYQSLPLVANKLWFSECDEIMYLVMPNSAQNPLNDDQMLYAWEGALTTAWVDQDTPELDHYFDELRLFTRNLTAASPRRWVEVDYQVDAAGDTSAWLRFAVDATTSPYQLLAVGDGNVTGRRVRFRLRLLTEDAKTPAVLNEWEARLNVMNEVLYDYVIDLRLLEKPMLLSGGESAAHAQSVIAQLQAWQEDATPLLMRSKYPAFDNVRGHIDPVSLVPTKWNPEETEYQGSLTFKQT